MSIKVLPSAEAHERRSGFSPYQDNGGTAVAVAGTDFCIIGADTRMSVGYNIATRNCPKTALLTSKCVIASSGMQADIKTLHKFLQARLTLYKYQHHTELQTLGLAQMLSNTLYYKRFFPYYTFNVLGGLDEEGRGCVFGYDAVGSYQRQRYVTTGSGQALIQPYLDNQVGFEQQKKNYVELTLDQTLDLVKDAFTSAGERDIHTGDAVELYIITRDGIRVERFNLKQD